MDQFPLGEGKRQGFASCIGTVKHKHGSSLASELETIKNVIKIIMQSLGNHHGYDIHN